MILIPHRENDPSPFEFPLSKIEKLQQAPDTWHLAVTKIKRLLLCNESNRSVLLTA